MKRQYSFLMLTIILLTAFFNTIIFSDYEQDISVHNLYSNHNKTLEIQLTRSEINDDWPMYGHDASHSSYSNTEAPRKYKLDWTFNTSGGGSRPPVIYDNKVFFGTTRNVIYALSVEDGKELWNYTTDGPLDTTPAVANNILIIGSLDSYVYAIDINNGSLIWKYNTTNSVTSPAIIKDGLVFIANSYQILSKNFGRLYAFDLDPSDKIDEGMNDPIGADYDVIWYQNISFKYDKIDKSPMIWNGKIFINIDLNIYIFDENDGTLLNIYPEEEISFSDSPMVSNNNLFLSGARLMNNTDIKVHVLRCYDPDTFKIIWEFTKEGQFYPSTPAGSNGEVFFSGKDHIYALPIDDPNNDGTIDDDEILWSYPINEGWSPAITNDEVVITNKDGIFCLDRSSGILLWSKIISGKANYYPPVIANEKIFIPKGIRTDFTVYGKYPSEFPIAAIKASSYESLSFVDIIFDASESFDDLEVVDYYYDFGDGEITGWIKDVSIYHNYKKPGNYTMKLKVKDNHELMSNFTEIQISILNRQPFIPNIKDKKIFENEYLNLIDEKIGEKINDPDGIITWIEIDYGDGVVRSTSLIGKYNNTNEKYDISDIPLEHIYKKSGDYEIIITIIDDFDGKNSTSFKLSVKERTFFDYFYAQELIQYLGFCFTILIITVIIIVFRRRKRLK